MLEQISSKIIDPETDCVKVFFCIRNEKFRLPYFLKYYRDLGVKEFFAVDNNSADGTREYLLEQDDVHVFFTEESYKNSNAGRAWTTKIAQKYGLGNWCLTLDVDEFLIYPYSEIINIPILCEYMDRWGYQGLFTIFLDFYSNKKLSETEYVEGESVFEYCNYYDSPKSYHTFSTNNFPYIQIKGGIRQRTFWDAGIYKSGPSMRKIPLVKWREDFDYLHSTHSCSQITLADVSGTLAHFKFLHKFEEHAKNEVARNERVGNSKDWQVYVNKLLAEDINFHDRNLSLSFEGSRKLVTDGLMACTANYFDYCFSRELVKLNRIDIKQHRKLNKYRLSEREEIREGESKPLSYDQLMTVWPAVAHLNQSLRYGKNTKPSDMNSILRIEDDIRSLVSSRMWGWTRGLRRMACKFRLVDQRAFMEEEFDNHSLYTRFRYTYGSIWWDLLAPLRIINKLLRKFVLKADLKE